MRISYKMSSIAMAVLMTMALASCAPDGGGGGGGVRKDALFEVESLAKYRSPVYGVEWAEGGKRTEKFVFKTVSESKMVWGGEVHFTNLEVAASGKAEVRLLEGRIESYKISPENVDFGDSLKNGKLTLSLQPNENVWIEINGDKQRPLMVFGNPVKDPVPAEAVYFPAGVHRIGRAYKVRSDTTLYLEDGAYLIGSIDARNSKNVTIMGRGIISGEYKSGSEVMAETGNSANWALFQEYFTLRGEVGQQGFVVDGVTIINTPNYNAWQVNEFHNVKILSPWVYTSDGFHAVPSGDKPGIVKNCFAFVADDVFYCNYNAGGNVEISDSFAASTNNNIFLIGYWGRKLDNDYRATVKNIYVKPFVEHAIFQCVIDGTTPETGFQNQTFEDIYIEGNIRCPLIWIQNRLYPWPEQHKNQMLGNARNITFRNVTLAGRQGELSKLLGLDAANGLQNILLENVSIDGVKVTSGNLAQYFETNEFVTDLQVK